MKKKRIGLDCHAIDGAYQGSRTHILETFSRVVHFAPHCEFYIFVENFNYLLEFSPSFSLPNVRHVNMPYSNPVKRLSYILPKMQKQHKLDLLHTQYIAPFPSYSPCVVTIHDILFEKYPEFFTTIFVLRSKILMKLSAKRAAHLFTVSEFSKNEIAGRYNVSPKSITVTHNGVDPSKFFSGDSGIEFLQRRGLKSGEYILSVGRLEPRKNHMKLLEAYRMLGIGSPPLVIAGQRFFGFNEIFDFIDKYKLKDRVHILEDVDNAELPALYRHAKLFVYPSWAEGFGIPPLEAMASGVPVVCSNTTAFPEIVGDAAILVTPHDESRLAGAINKVLDSPSLCQQMIAQGKVQSQKFTWENSAKQILGGYELVLAK